MSAIEPTSVMVDEAPTHGQEALSDQPRAPAVMTVVRPFRWTMNGAPLVVQSFQPILHLPRGPPNSTCREVQGLGKGQ